MLNAGDSHLKSPLLEESSVTEAPPSRKHESGGVTLHGEPVDVCHMARHADDTFLARVDEHDTEEAGAQSTGSLPLSVEQPPSPFGNDATGRASKSAALEYVRQAGRAACRRTQRTVGTFLRHQPKGLSPVGGLTPVVENNATASPSVNDPSPSLNDTANRLGSSANNSHEQPQDELTQKSSLFRSPTTPLLPKCLLPLLLLANHVVFYHAQTKPMWNLAYSTDISVTLTASTLKAKAAADVLALPHFYNVTRQETTVAETFTYMDAIRKLWQGKGLGDAKTLSKVAAVLLVVASGIWPHLKLLLLHLCWFWPFVHSLWIGRDDGRGQDNAENPARAHSRCCKSNRRGRRYRAGHRHYWTRTRRSTWLRTLSALGKWSLADVLVVCILIAVLHLDWQVDPVKIRTGLEAQLPTLLEYAHGKYPDPVDDCARLLGHTCGRHAKVLDMPKCVACQALISNAFSHPDWTSGQGRDILDGITLGGGGTAQLRVAGMAGTYYFCGAVLLSITLSLVVDWLDGRDRGKVEENLLDRRRELEFIMVPPSGQGEGASRGSRIEEGVAMGNDLQLREESPQPLPLNEALSLDQDPSPLLQSPVAAGGDDRQRHLPPSSYARLRRSDSIPSPTTNCHLLKQTVLVILSLLSLPLVCYAVTLPTCQRLVFGGGPTLLHELLGVVWEQEYSLVSLVRVTGDAGGWDAFLMATFGAFAVAGPLLRAACLATHTLLGLPMTLLGERLERERYRRGDAVTMRRALHRAACAFRRALLPVIDALGALCCWEVLIVALVMIQLEIPSITDTIYQDERCRLADPEHGNTCIEVQFNATEDFLLVGVAWMVLAVASGLAMNLAGDEDAGRVGMAEENRYEFGQPIPLRRSNLSRDRAWKSPQSDGQGKEGKEDSGEDGDEYYSPLQPGGGHTDQGLEQIVFV